MESVAYERKWSPQMLGEKLAERRLALGTAVAVEKIAEPSTDIFLVWFGN